jgi:hypothetical protein
MKVQRVLGLGVLAGLLAAAAMAVSAQASNLKGVCMIEGSTGVTDKEGKNVGKPSLPFTTGGQKGVRLSGGHGRYDFASLAIACMGNEKGEPVMVSLTVISTGWFDSVICGVGTAFSDGMALTSVQTTGTKDSAFYEAVVQSLQYKIEFIGLTGHIHINNDPDSPVKDIPKELFNVLPQDKAPGKPDEPLFFAGLVRLDFNLPDNLDVLNNKAGKDPTDFTKYNCVNGFAVSGVVMIDKTPK